MTSMEKFMKKPVIIEAVQWYKLHDVPEDIVRYIQSTDIKYERGIYDICKHCVRAMNIHGWVTTIEGGHIVCPGDWVIQGVLGEYYPCKPDIFALTYEPLGSSEREPKDLPEELTSILNRFNQEKGSDTPDFLLAEYLLGCLATWNTVVTKRDDFWYGRVISRRRTLAMVKGEGDEHGK